MEGVILESLTISGEGVQGSKRDKKEVTASGDSVEKAAAVKETKEDVENVKPSDDAAAAGEHILEILSPTSNLFIFLTY